MDKAKNLKPKTGQTPKKPPRKNLWKQTDNVEVFCRIRPLDNQSEPVSVKKLNDTTVILSNQESMSALKSGSSSKETRHTFQYVFDESTKQHVLFDHVALPQVDDVLHGKNALLFAYGVTSSGKTHTMTGSRTDFGLLPRCLDCIFNSIVDVQARKYVFKPDKMNGFDVQTEVDAMLERQTRDVTSKLNGAGKNLPAGNQKDRTTEQISTGPRDGAKIDDIEPDNSYAVFVSYVEIYNNYVYDLLEEPPVDAINGTKAPTSKNIREDSEHNMYVSGVQEMEVKTTEEAYEYLLKGKKRRKVAYTALNSESSRSHSVFSIRVVQAPLDPCGDEVLQDKKRICASQLCLVDLAGSERTGRTGSAGDRLKEAGNINQSLMALRSCIEALRENQKTGVTKVGRDQKIVKGYKMVPYRDSRLTHLFKNYFDGEGKVRMIVCVNPKACEYEETVQVMKFAELTQEVQIVRSQEVRFDLGLTPGRRLINQQFKDAQTKAREEGLDDAAVLAPRIVYSLGPPFPSLETYDAGIGDTNSLLCKFLRDREACRTTLLLDISNKEEVFRSRLLEIERELAESKLASAQLRTMQRAKEVELSEVQKRNTNLEQTNEHLRSQIVQYELERQELEREVGEKSWKCLQEKLEKDRMQQDYNARLVMNEQQYSHNIEQTKRRLKEETAVQLRSKQKLDMLRRIINAESDSGGSVSSTPTSASDVTSQRPTFLAPLSIPPSKSRIVPAHSESDLLNAGSDERLAYGAGVATPSRFSHQRPASTAPLRTIQRAGRAKSPPPVKAKPLVAKKNHRRSRSNESIWVEHKPDAYSDNRTLLQPRMKTIKSVTKLSEKDIRNREATKYVLNHNDLDSEGEMATQLVKGDILTSAGGGTSVVFTDIEVLKQKTCESRKRVSSNQRADNYDDEEEWTDVETRCSTAIEGHAKKYKLSAV